MGQLSKLFFCLAAASAAGFSVGTAACLVHATVKGLDVDLFLYRVSLVALGIFTFAGVGGVLFLMGH